jgi:hypothetical protein
MDHIPLFRKPSRPLAAPDWQFPLSTSFPRPGHGTAEIPPGCGFCRYVCSPEQHAKTSTKKLPENPGRTLFYEAKYKPTERQPADEATNVCLSGERIAPKSIEGPGVVSEDAISVHRQDQQPQWQQNQHLHDANDIFANCFQHNS